MLWTTGMHYVDAGLAAALFVALAWWMYYLTARPRARPVPATFAAKVAAQPWGEDKPGGRGNR